MVASYLNVFQRDFERLKVEIENYKVENILWQKAEGINNPAGNLALHLVGNLKTYIGKNLGGFEYQRFRDLEFSEIVSKVELLKRIEETAEIVIKTLETIQKEDLEKLYPENVLGYEMTTEHFLIHLYGHFNYHLGQINYHRRILCSK